MSNLGVDQFTHARRKKFAELFARLYDEQGPAAAGKAAREEFPNMDLFDPDVAAALRPYIVTAMEDLGYEFPDEGGPLETAF